MAGGGVTTAGVGGVGGVLLTSMMLLSGEEPFDVDKLQLPTHSVNVDHSILAKWMSEELDSLDDEPLSSECAFFDFSRQYESEFCDAFTISRMQVGTLRVAVERALRCAAKAATECVLSPEIGLAIPAVFLAAPESASGMRMLIAPRVVYPDENATKLTVRVFTPGDTFSTKTLWMDSLVKIEYMTTAKEVVSETLTGDAAFCVNLLRLAYEASCWSRLDG